MNDVFPVSNAQELGMALNEARGGETIELAGDGSDGSATGKRLSVRGGSDIVIEDNEFGTFHRGLVMGDVDDVRLIGNDVNSMRSDGMNFAYVQNVLIENNHIHDLTLSKASADHADMIQFWTNGGSRPSTGVIIRDNKRNVGEGDASRAAPLVQADDDLADCGDMDLFMEEAPVL